MTWSAGRPSKTVYVLGAGFSRDAGFPLQAKILDRTDQLSLGLMDLPPGVYDLFVAAHGPWSEFRRIAFPAAETPRLEDIFTLLDQTISNRGFFAGYSFEELAKVREALKRSILFVFHAAGEKMDKKAADFYRSVAAYLLERRAVAGQESDPFSIVSLNWDCLLENTIYSCIEQMDAYGKADVDYCCYTTPLSKSCPHTPSLLQKAKGLLNLKIMKLHGSANWLLCPNCNRLYTGVGSPEEVWGQYVAPHPCPTCRKFLSVRTTRSPDSLPQLEPFFITPTFVKVFDNAHIQMTWHNAYMDLAEATEVVFIGYSFPRADYHVRTLLRRAIQPHASIVVVLTRGDEPNRNTPKRVRRYFATTRFREFFGPERVSFELGGVGTYFRRAMGRKKLSDRLTLVRQMLAK